MIYKIIPGPTRVTFDNNDLTMVTNYFQKLINEQAAEGWVYHSMETVVAHQNAKAGCFGLIKKQGEVTTNIYMLIFCREN